MFSQSAYRKSISVIAALAACVVVVPAAQAKFISDGGGAANAQGAAPTRGELMQLREPRTPAVDSADERVLAVQANSATNAGPTRGELMQLREPRPPIVVEPTYVAATGGAGFDWNDAGAGIGIGVGASAALLLGGLLVAARRRSTFAGA